MFFETGILLGNSLLHPAVDVTAQCLLASAFLLGVIRLVKGPDVVDRVVALDLIAGVILALTLFYAIRLGDVNFMNVGIAIAIVAFISTVAIARYLESQCISEPAEEQSTHQ